MHRCSRNDILVRKARVYRTGRLIQGFGILETCVLAPGGHVIRYKAELLIKYRRAMVVPSFTNDGAKFQE